MTTRIYWENAHETTGKIPINMLPFFVWLTATKADPLYYEFDKIYTEFIKAFDISNCDTKEFKAWCSDQATHFYECNH